MPGTKTREQQERETTKRRLQAAAKKQAKEAEELAKQEREEAKKAAKREYDRQRYTMKTGKMIVQKYATPPPSPGGLGVVQDTTTTPACAATIMGNFTPQRKDTLFGIAQLKMEFTRDRRQKNADRLAQIKKDRETNIHNAHQAANERIDRNIVHGNDQIERNVAARNRQVRENVAAGNRQVMELFKSVKNDFTKQAEESILEENKLCAEEIEQYNKDFESVAGAGASTMMAPRQLGFESTDSPLSAGKPTKSTGKELRKMTPINETSPMLTPLGTAETPLSVGSIRQLVKTTGTTKPEWFLVGPNGTTVQLQISEFIGEESMDSVVDMAVTEKHIVTLSEGGEVTAFDFAFKVHPKEPEQPRKASGWGLPSFPWSSTSGKKATPSPKFRIMFPNGEPIIGIGCCGSLSMAVDVSGTVWSWTDSNLQPVQVSLDDDSIGKVVKAIPGGTFFMAIGEDNSLYAFPHPGMEDECQINKGRINLPRGRAMLKVATGHNHCLLLAQHTGARGANKNPLNLYTMGENKHGQLGLGNKEHSQRIPKEVTKYGRKKIMDITANTTCSFALADPSMFFAFGTFANIETSRPDTVSIDQIDFQAVAANDGYYLGVEKPVNHDDILWMVTSDNNLIKIRLPDSRVLVKITNMVVGPTFSLIHGEVAESVAKSASACTAGTTLHSDDEGWQPPAAKKLKMTPGDETDKKPAAKK